MRSVSKSGKLTRLTRPLQKLVPLEVSESQPITNATVLDPVLDTAIDTTVQTGTDDTIELPDERVKLIRRPRREAAVRGEINRRIQGVT